MERKVNVKDRLGWGRAHASRKDDQRRVNPISKRQDRVESQPKSKYRSSWKRSPPNRSNKPSDRKTSTYRETTGGFSHHRKGPSSYRSPQPAPRRVYRSNPSFKGKVQTVQTPPESTTCQFSRYSKEDKDPYLEIPVIVCFKRVPARLDCASVVTRVGMDIGNLVMANGASYREVTTRIDGKQRIMKTLLVPLGVRVGRMKRVSCVIDPDLPPRIVILGLPAIKMLSFRMTIDNIAVEYKAGAERPTLEVSPEVDTQWALEGADGEFIDFLDEREAEEIRNL